jgi:hypothetical protein
MEDVMFRSPLRALALGLAAAAALATHAPLAHAQIWTESGDAGPLPATAQQTAGVGPLVEIDGTLQSPDDVDLYCIHVTDVAGFAANLQCVVIQGPDLWLFDPATGKGVAMTSLCAAGAKGMNGALLPGTGDYVIGVSYDAYYPFNGVLPLWAFGYTPQRAPDGAGALLPVTTWTGQVNVQPLNPYKILLSGVTFCEAPTPAVGASWGAVKSIYR